MTDDHVGRIWREGRKKKRRSGEGGTPLNIHELLSRIVKLVSLSRVTWTQTSKLGKSQRSTGNVVSITAHNSAPLMGTELAQTSHQPSVYSAPAVTAHIIRTAIPSSPTELTMLTLEFPGAGYPTPSHANFTRVQISKFPAVGQSEVNERKRGAHVV
ncbi:hypothetical protein BDP67DRAFT_499256 [Colletotrichum lupini]|nr:hypothetical protein BDP67DRAFT_499256 [Colletotrichum lupini]